MKHLVDKNGEFIGSFDDSANVPEALIQVPSPPKAEGAKWDGAKWTVPVHALSRMKSSAKSEIVKACTDAARAVLDRYSEAEILSFSAKEIEARKWLADNTVPTPIIDAEISASDVSKSAMVESIIAKADKIMIMAGTLAGIRSRNQSSVESASTPEQVSAAVDRARIDARNAVATALS